MKLITKIIIGTLVFILIIIAFRYALLVTMPQLSWNKDFCKSHGFDSFGSFNEKEQKINCFNAQQKSDYPMLSTLDNRTIKIIKNK